MSRHDNDNDMRTNSGGMDIGPLDEWPAGQRLSRPAGLPAITRGLCVTDSCISQGITGQARGPVVDFYFEQD
eukprot:2387230-Rhodomonas_salina.1